MKNEIHENISAILKIPGKPKAQILSLLQKKLAEIDPKTGKSYYDGMTNYIVESACQGKVLMQRKWGTQLIVDHFIGKPKERSDDSGTEEEKWVLPAFLNETIDTINKEAKEEPKPVDEDQIHKQTSS